ncbi:PREDICTED: LETM1 and EF-hand domain-containing protein anon-60Da, mitochondrial-like [Diuraphis noxia]|uniref:LETM1 and EF-hand domain-containing protein anon-60Da, mitochondrial-like n=1 Tax=Diuraphis noxia TaxID=143948 RepID=UPI00076377B1|nr:PREDICTED: LETM1 and EF-hand domain-containing protein anon-60Da, mitochondrial-like [Diuraphis noxia]
MNITRAAKSGLRPYGNLYKFYDNKHFGAICLNPQPCSFSNNFFYSSGASNRLLPISHLTTKLEFSNPYIRQISYTSSLLSEKPSSKIEETVNAVKEKAQKEAEGKEIATVKPTKTIKQKIIDEVMHYYHGFKLLGLNAKISFKLALKKMRGQDLTRREHNLFVETVADLFRLLPFSVFIIVPFLEFTLPIFIKIFPGMLPTTFQTKDDKEAKLKKSLKVKLEMAKFLQETLDNMSVSGKGHTCESAKEFADFFAKVRQEGTVISADEILKFSKLFKDEITLDSLPRPQLVALCRVLELRPIGTSNFLRFQLTLKLRSLAIDDKVIQKEGVDLLTLSELQQACKSRGMRAYGLTEKRLKQQLTQWLDLSLNEKVPPSLLLLSRAFSFTENIPTSDLLKKAISSLPNSVGVSTEADLGERDGVIDNKAKLEAIKEEERKVKEEIEECLEEKKKEQEDAKKKPKEQTILANDNLVDTAPILTDTTGIKEENVTLTDLKTLENAIENLSSEQKTLIVEKEEIKELKDELKDYQEDINDLQEVMKTEKKEKVRESKAAKRLFKKVNNMIKNMDQVVDKLETKEKEIKKGIEVKELVDENTINESELINIEDLIGAVRKLQNVPDEFKLQQISEVLSKIDDDHDGSIRLDTVLKVLELIGTENIKLSSKEMDMITQLVIKEEEMETIEKMNKIQKSEKDDLTQTTTPKVVTTSETITKKTVTPIIDSKIVSDSKIPPLPPTSSTKSDETKKL